MYGKLYVIQMNPNLTQPEIETLVRNWQTRSRDQPLNTHKLKVASARAYLLGAYLSDGHLRWPTAGEPHPVWSGLRDKYFADCISIALHTIGSPHSLRITDKPRFHWNARPKSYRVYERDGGKLGGWLDDVAPDKDCLPYIPRELVRPFVAGLMDGDGGIYRSPKDQYILHYAGDSGFVGDFHVLLRSIGVQVNGSFPIDSQVSLNIESFLKAGLCFAMYRKQRHLVGWCRNVITTAKSRDRADDLRKAAVAKWYLANANHLKAGWSPADERIPTGRMTYQEESNE